jgi:hypothetical protein
VTYLALIKVDLDEPKDRQAADIRDGLHELAVRLVDEYGLTPLQVAEWFEDGANAAYEESRA